MLASDSLYTINVKVKLQEIFFSRIIETRRRFSSIFPVLGSLENSQSNGITLLKYKFRELGEYIPRH